MTGKRLLDALQFLNVAKSVAGKHLAIRQQQLDVYTRTSSITKGVKEQTDNWIITAKAASALARRFNETSSSPSSPEDRATGSTEADLGSHIVEKDVSRNAQIAKDVNWTKLNNAKDVHAERNLSVDEARGLQNQTEFHIPEKQPTHELKPTVNTHDTSYSPSLNSAPGLSSFHKAQIPDTADVSLTSDPGITSGSLNSSVSDSPTSALEEPSEEFLQGAFRSRKVSSLLLSKKNKPYILERQSQLAKHEAAQKETVDIPKNDSKQEIHDDVGILNASDSAIKSDTNVIEGPLKYAPPEPLPENPKVRHHAKLFFWQIMNLQADN